MQKHVSLLAVPPDSFSIIIGRALLFVAVHKLASPRTIDRVSSAETRFRCSSWAERPRKARRWFTGESTRETKDEFGIRSAGNGGVVAMMTLSSPASPVAHINRIATAVPGHEVHTQFICFAEHMLEDERTRNVFLRMALRSEISRRFSSLQVAGQLSPGSVSAYEFYRRDAFPSTAQRMMLFERFAPALMRCALDRLALTPRERSRIRHVLVTSCTGFYAPGLDFDAIDHLGLSPSVERTMIGFMGCYAAVNALKLARHIVRSQPEDSVLIVNLELCTLHFRETQDLGEVLSFLVFGDGCAASLVSADANGFALDAFQSIQIPDTRDLITWRVRDLGFDMLLSGRVPGEIGKTLREHAPELTGNIPIDLWAIHPGGRSVLDAVERALRLPTSAMCASRKVLDQFGNMSSATIMFVLEELLRSAGKQQHGCAMSFGPGLTAETMQFHAV